MTMKMKVEMELRRKKKEKKKKKKKQKKAKKKKKKKKKEAKEEKEEKGEENSEENAEDAEENEEIEEVQGLTELDINNVDVDLESSQHPLISSILAGIYSHTASLIFFLSLLLVCLPNQF
jgi:hypothetical protein